MKRSYLCCGLASLLAGLLLMLSACIPSLHPFYTPEDRADLPGLEGRWAEDSDSENVWDFRREGEEPGRYTLIIHADDEAATHTAQIFRVAEHFYLDLYPADPDDIPYIGYNAVPAHYAMRLQLDAAGLQIWYMDFNATRELVRSQPDTVKHEWVADSSGVDPDSDNLVLTAGTRELQEFLVKQQAVLFTDMQSMKRVE